MNRSALLLLASAGCDGVDLTGDWLGVCDAGDADARVLATVSESDDVRSAQVTVNRVERADLTLVVHCAAIDESGDEVSVGRCRGAWDSADVPNDLSLSGTMAKADPVPVWRGDCRVDDVVGQLELWRIP